MGYIIFGTLNLIIILFLIYKSNSKLYDFDKIAEFISINYYSFILGDKARINEEIRIYSGNKDNTKMALEIIKENCLRYLVLWIATSFILMAFGLISIQALKEVDYLKRPDPGKPIQNISLSFETKIGDDKYTNNALIKLKPQNLSNKKQNEILENFINTIPTIILGENESLMKVSKPLNLISFAKESGIYIEWQSGDTKLIENDGFVYSININNPKAVKLTAKFRLNDLETEKIYQVNVINSDEKSYIEKIFRRDLEIMSKKINNSSNNEYLFLPTSNTFGNKISWHKDFKNFASEIMLIFIIAFSLVYLMRHSNVTNKSKQYKSSILKELPSFVTKLILLINSGLVVSSALEKIAFEYEATIRKQSKISIYEEILILEYKVLRTKSSLSIELKELGERTSIRELSRFASIIGENINKGSELIEKLESESEILWLNRKKQVEEKARIAETKMTLPLLILLIILIIITIAPVLVSF